MMLWSLESLKQFDVSWMPQRLQNVYLLCHLPLCALLFDEVSVRRLNCYKFTSQSVQSKVHFAKCSSAQDSTDLVQLNSCLWHLLMSLKTVSYNLTQKGYFPVLRCHWFSTWVSQIIVILLLLMLQDHKWVLQRNNRILLTSICSHLRVSWISVQSLVSICWMVRCWFQGWLARLVVLHRLELWKHGIFTRCTYIVHFWVDNLSLFRSLDYTWFLIMLQEQFLSQLTWSLDRWNTLSRDILPQISFLAWHISIDQDLTLIMVVDPMATSSIIWKRVSTSTCRVLGASWKHLLGWFIIHHLDWLRWSSIANCSLDRWLCVSHLIFLLQILGLGPHFITLSLKIVFWVSDLQVLGLSLILSKLWLARLMASSLLS